MSIKWLEWAQRIQSISQAGIEYTKDPFDRERFEQLRQLSVEIVTEYTNLEFEKVKDLFAGETGYQTPKVDVRAVVIQGREILLVQELDGKWSLPGGWAEPGLTVKENIVKEVREEAGIEIAPESLIALLDRNSHVSDTYPYSIYKIFVRCRYLRGAFEQNIETMGARFFKQDHLPELSETRNTREQIDLCFNRAESDDVIFD